MGTKTDGGDIAVDVPLNTDTKAKCICKSCLTFIKNSLMGDVFCSAGSSAKTPEMKGCNCPGCEVYADYELNGGRRHCGCCWCG